jgi:hypothetical protein
MLRLASSGKFQGSDKKIGNISETKLDKLFDLC